MSTPHWHLTTHAISRFRERVRPGLAWEHAERELETLLRLADESETAPAWLHDRPHDAAQRYLVVGDLAMPLAPSAVASDHWVVLTCLTRGGIGPGARAARNVRRRRRTPNNGRQRHRATRPARPQRSRTAYSY